VEVVSTNLINVRNRQTLSGYPTLRYIYEQYMNAGIICGVESNKLSYSSVAPFVDLFGTHWIDLIEQVVPATTIWGSTYVYRNTVFDRQKYAYKRYNLLPCITTDDLPGCVGTLVITNDFYKGGPINAAADALFSSCNPGCEDYFLDHTQWSITINTNLGSYTGPVFETSTYFPDYSNTLIAINDAVTEVGLTIGTVLFGDASTSTTLSGDCSITTMEVVLNMAMQTSCEIGVALVCVDTYPLATVTMSAVTAGMAGLEYLAYELDVDVIQEVLLYEDEIQDKCNPVVITSECSGVYIQKLTADNEFRGVVLNLNNLEESGPSGTGEIIIVIENSTE